MVHFCTFGITELHETRKYQIFKMYIFGINTLYKNRMVHFLHSGLLNFRYPEYIFSGFLHSGILINPPLTPVLQTLITTQQHTFHSMFNHPALSRTRIWGKPPSAKHRHLQMEWKLYNLFVIFTNFKIHLLSKIYHFTNLRHRKILAKLNGRMKSERIILEFR